MLLGKLMLAEKVELLSHFQLSPNSKSDLHSKRGEDCDGGELTSVHGWQFAADYREKQFTRHTAMKRHSK
jgi:hypothetical protein